MGLNNKKGLTLTETVVGVTLLVLVWIGVMNIIVLGKASRSRLKERRFHKPCVLIV